MRIRVLSLPAGVAFLSLVSTTPVQAALLECVAAEVNGEIVTLSDVVRQRKALLGEIYRLKLSDDETRKKLEEAKGRMVDDLIDEKLLLQRARDTGVTASREEVDQIVKSIMEQNGLADEAALERALGTEDLSVAQLRSNIERRTTIEKVRQYEVASKIVVTEDEARRYYDEHRDDFREVERVRLREIVLLVEKRDAEQVKKEIAEIANLIKNGADFSELATLFSQAPTAEHGGDLGLVRVSDLAVDIRDTAAGLEAGQVSAPVETKYGFHILKLVERKPVSYQSFEDARDAITRRAQESRYGDRYESYVAGIRKNAFIKLHDTCIARGM